MAYATIEDVQSRMTRELSEQERTVCGALLEDVAVLIDSFNESAKEQTKKIVSCRAVIRAIGDGNQSGVPIGASQGSMSALGYSQSWTMGSGSTGEIYLSKTEKQMLGGGDRIGSYSPVQELISDREEWP
jgi:hypothetical protein